MHDNSELIEFELQGWELGNRIVRSCRQQIGEDGHWGRGRYFDAVFLQHVESSFCEGLNRILPSHEDVVDLRLCEQVSDCDRRVTRRNGKDDVPQALYGEVG